MSQEKIDYLQQVCFICKTNIPNRDLGIFSICDCCLEKFLKCFCNQLDNDIDRSIALKGMLNEFQNRQGYGPTMAMIKSARDKMRGGKIDGR